MDFKELDSFRLSDAVKFHHDLNPKLWKNHELDPKVKDQLLVIAKDFVTELGISDLDIEDITISGSNAAYTYTPHSDLDLHILVDMSKLPNDEVYKELFNAKKTLYNDSHDITIRGIPIELYVQDSNQPHHSLGEYSLLTGNWTRIPKKRRANFDQNATRAKYEKLRDFATKALKSKKSELVTKALQTIRQYRQAGLDKGGEFGPENLAFKAIRSKGLITQLYKLRDELHSKELSIQETVSKINFDDVIKDILKTVPDVEEIYFHGSRATGKHKPSSDIDLLVVLPEEYTGEEYLKRVKVLQNISKQYNNFDIQPARPGSNIHRVAKEEGKLLYSSNVDEDYDPNGPPPGPEFKPTMPAGTIRVDVSDVYDWYKLGQHISNLKGLGKHDFGKGPPSTILSFGDEDLEHQYIKALQQTGLDTTDIDPVDPKQPKGMKRQKVDPTYNVGVAEGGAETSWSTDTEKITLQDILELTKHIEQINLPINDNLKSRLIHWDGNPEEIERINQVTVSNQFPILIILDGQGQIDYILDGNHRLHKAIKSQAKTIPAKLIKPSDLNDKAKRILHIKEQGVTNNVNEDIEDSFTGYRGVGEAELKEILKTGHALPSTDLMPFDNEIIEYSIGEESFEEMSDQDVEQWIQDTVPWYNGSLQSVKGGVNFTTDEFNAEGYGEYLLGLKVNGPYVDFSDIHSFAKNYKDVEVVAYKKHDTDDWIEVKKKVGENKDSIKQEKAITLTNLPRFFKDGDKLADIVPERKNATYALHPDKWQSTFYSLTNKDPKKLKYYRPKYIEIPDGTLVGDMALANRFYRAVDEKEKQLYAELYKQSLKPYPVDLSQYKMPELLIFKQVELEENASGYIPSKKQANDPRFKTALTVDVKPDTLKKNAKAFGFKISRAGIPPLLREGEVFNKCFDKACKVYDRAVEKNLKPKMYQVADYQGEAEDADSKWLKLPKHVWSHYVTVVGNTVYDPTAKQFGPDKETKYSVDKLQSDWGKIYQIRPKKGVAENFPQPGISSGKAKQFKSGTKIQTKEMTLDEVLSTVKGIPYVKEVIDDWDAKDYSWGVTEKVIEYAKYLKNNPQSVANLPPLVVIDGELNDGAHRLSAINLLQKRMDPKNPLWKQVKLKVNFGSSADVVTEQGVKSGKQKVEKDGIILDVAIDGATVDIRPIVDGIQAGYVVFDRDGKTLVADDLAIDEKYRGRGLAKIMYDYVKELGFNIKRSHDQTTLGKKFWDKHKGQEGYVWESKYDYSLSDYEKVGYDDDGTPVDKARDPNIGPQEGKYLNLMLKKMKPITVIGKEQPQSLLKQFQPYIDDKTLSLAYKSPRGVYISLPGEEWRGKKLDMLWQKMADMAKGRSWRKDNPEFKLINAKIGRLLGIPKESVKWYLDNILSSPKQEVAENDSTGIEAYHGSRNLINSFKPFSHFGTFRAAEQRLEDTNVGDDSEQYMYRVQLSLNNPIKLEKDINDVHKLSTYVDMLSAMRILDSNEAKSIKKPIDLIKLLQEKGYDGFTYRNNYEDMGSRSYVVLDPNQVKIVDTIPYSDYNKIVKIRKKSR